MYTPGNCEVIVNYLTKGSFLLFYPEQLIQELKLVPSKPKLARIKIEQINRLITLIQNRGIFVNLEDTLPVSRDPKDDAYIACAMAAKCDLIISGDKDLRSIGEYNDIKSLSPSDFLRRLIQK